MELSGRKMEDDTCWAPGNWELLDCLWNHCDQVPYGMTHTIAAQPPSGFQVARLLCWVQNKENSD